MRFGSRNRRAFRWVIAGVLWQMPAALAQAPADEGRRLFEAGADAYAKGQHELAIAAFNEAYRRTQRPGLLFSLAQAHRGAYEQTQSGDHLRAAMDFYREYLKQTPTGPRADKARSYLERLTVLQGAKVPAADAPPSEPLAPPVAASPGVLEVTGNRGAELFVDGLSRGTLPTRPLSIPAGEHVLEVRQAGHVPLQRKITVAAKRTLRLTLEARPTTQRITGLTMLGVGGGAVLVGGALGYVALRKDSEALRLDQEEPNNVDAYNAAASSRNTFRLAAALTASAGLAVGVGGLLAVLLDNGAPASLAARPNIQRERLGEARTWVPDCRFGTSVLQIGVRGTF